VTDAVVVLLWVVVFDHVVEDVMLIEVVFVFDDVLLSESRPH